MSDEREDFLRRCAASCVPEDIAVEWWEDMIQAEAERVRARILRHVEAARSAEDARRLQ